MGEEVVSNKQITLKDLVKGFLKETDMVLKVSSIKLKVPDDCNSTILVKNLHLSCNPYMWSRMGELKDSYVPSFTPGEHGLQADREEVYGTWEGSVAKLLKHLAAIEVANPGTVVR